MFNWVLNTILTLSSNIIWQAYGSITVIRFSGFVYHSYFFYIMNIRNVKKNIKNIPSNAKN